MCKRILVLAATMAVAGCIWKSRPSNPFTQGGSEAIRLVARNHNFHQVTLKALGRVQRRIGIVPGNSRETFTIDWPGEEVLIIEIDLLAGGSYSTNAISLSPGKRPRSMFRIRWTRRYCGAADSSAAGETGTAWKNPPRATLCVTPLPNGAAGSPLVAPCLPAPRRSRCSRDHVRGLLDPTSAAQNRPTDYGGVT